MIGRFVFLLSVPAPERAADLHGTETLRNPGAVRPARRANSAAAQRRSCQRIRNKDGADRSRRDSFVCVAGRQYRVRLELRLRLAADPARPARTRLIHARPKILCYRIIHRNYVTVTKLVGYVGSPEVVVFRCLRSYVTLASTFEVASARCSCAGRIALSQAGRINHHHIGPSGLVEIPEALRQLTAGRFSTPSNVPSLSE
jgi:hypothetical protein